MSAIPPVSVYARCTRPLCNVWGATGAAKLWRTPSRAFSQVTNHLVSLPPASDGSPCSARARKKLRKPGVRMRHVQTSRPTGRKACAWREHSERMFSNPPPLSRFTPSMSVYASRAAVCSFP